MLSGVRRDKRVGGGLPVPVMRGDVQRRLLVNYRADPGVIAPLLPAPFEPQVIKGFAVVGICLIRLGNLRPRGLPAALGFTSENAAHRIAVRWSDESGSHTGVYIPQRHSGSRLNVLVGDRLFPGAHDRATFDVRESSAEIAVALTSSDSTCHVKAAVTVTDRLIGSELFCSTDDASAFFRAGSIGFSPSRRRGVLHGLELRTHQWHIEPAQLHGVRSSMFDDAVRFPSGSVRLDCALVMRNVPVEWHEAGHIMTPVVSSSLAGER